MTHLNILDDHTRHTSTISEPSASGGCIVTTAAGRTQFRWQRTIGCYTQLSFVEKFQRFKLVYFARLLQLFVYFNIVLRWISSELLGVQIILYDLRAIAVETHHRW
jgi:hypothetical protein